MNITADKLAAIYLKMRQAIQDKEDEVKKIKAEQEVITEHLLELCDKQNTDGLTTPSGTISRRVLSKFWTSDWERMYEFIKEHNATHLLEKRIHNGNMKEFLAENPDLCPTGLQSNRSYSISVRKPKAKS
tara:strand:- start:11783 stop:12172 length:390 start_codon:yes stop_codon:yes gene_type:complete